MTLIVGVASRPYLLQVADRRLTYQNATFDEMSNKNLVYIGSDGIAVMGYTGPAYIAGRPTDQWIAETLLGKNVDDDGKPWAFGSSNHAVLSVGGMLRKVQQSIVTGLTAADRAAWRPLRFELMVVGWQTSKSTWRPFYGEISKKPGSATFDLSHTSRHRFNPDKLLLAATPEENVTGQQGRDLMQKLKSSADVEIAERHVVDLVREVHKQVPQVGPNCISIAVRAPELARVRVRYLPVSGTAKAVIAGEEQTMTVPVAFSPWVIGPGSFASPGLLSGSFDICAGGATVHVEAPEMKGFGFFGSQQRPEPPK